MKKAMRSNLVMAGFRKQRKASALVIVLSSLAFMTALALAFLASVGTELRSSKRYADGVSLQLLSQSAFSYVQTQIVEGTRGVDALGSPLAWASQPGMIRTYTVEGNPGRHFKLYSSDEMIGSGVFDPDAADEKVPLTGAKAWYNQPGIYTNLNEPISVAGADVYPILSGRDIRSISKTPSNVNTTPYLSYDSNKDGLPDIDGFAVDPGEVSYDPDSEVTPSNNPVPMPVKWLYVLQDGEIAPATSTSNLKEAKVAGASAANPIVGRIAFWTDDETCKLNINTASEGTYADFSRANYTQSPDGTGISSEQNLARKQPVNGEFQRYPGHPAMVSLSTVIKAPSGFNDQQWGEELFKMVPRVNTGGSAGGTVQTTVGAGTPAITPDADRLYASLDELAFKPLTVSGSRDPNNATVLNKASLDRARFFLTPSSRAPDLNLFNKPRVSIWPISVIPGTENSHRSPYDKLMIFCSTVNNSIYYFQRLDPLSPTVDLPEASDAAPTGLGRNRMLLEYLRTLSGESVPGFGGNFVAKYGRDNDQILIQIFDYIRSSNLRDVNVTTKYTSGSGTWNSGVGQVVPIRDRDKNTSGLGRIRTIMGATLIFIANADGDEPASQPSSDPVPAGKLRVQAMLIPQLIDPAVGSVSDLPRFTLVIKNLQSLRWSESVLDAIPSSMFPATPLTLNNNYYPLDNSFYGDQYGIKQAIQPNSGGLVSERLDVAKVGTMSFFGGEVMMELRSPSGEVYQEVTLKFPQAVGMPLPNLAPSNAWTYPWNYGVTDTSGPYNMRYFKAPPAPAQPNQLSGPDLPGDNTPTRGGRITGLFNAPSDNVAVMFTSYDVVRSVTLAHGDVRLSAARKDPPASVYEPLGNYGSGRVAGMHSFWNANGNFFYGAVGGRLVRGANYDALGTTATYFNRNSMEYSLYKSDGKTPLPGGPGGKGGPNTGSGASDVPFNGVAMGKSNEFGTGDVVGDFDNAPGLCRDGPWINKADEGDSGAAGSYIPYINWHGKTGIGAITTSLFTPNRQIPSAVTFGSLPTGVWSERPWQTLLFRPDPSKKHPGNKDRNGVGAVVSGMPADHLYLDLFNMPVVEPYAISEPLSTAGKINMNYQIVPFTYITRDTGIRAVLKSEKVIAIADSQANTYKQWSVETPKIRFDVNQEETLKGFNYVFDGMNPDGTPNPARGKDIFRSATEICEIPIVPNIAGVTNATMTTTANTNFWNTRRLTGDNSKERPYATIYPRLTTKSNTFTIYARVQTLKKRNDSDPAVWMEGRDMVTGESRGYQTIERYIDPNDPRIPDYAVPTNNTPISTFYKTRVLAAKQFAP